MSLGRPYLFLDVDGVLNALDGLNRGDWPDFKKHKVHLPIPGYSEWRKFTVRVSPKMCQALAELPVDIRWATTWEDQANATLRELTGFPKHPVACRVGETEQTMQGLVVVEKHWKWLDIQVQLEADPRPLVWIDDEDIPWNAAADLRLRGIPHLFIKPVSEIGITRAHVDEVRTFLEELDSA